MSDTNQDRKRAVREAWKGEKAQVREGKGTRDWSQSEQRQIVAKGRANGYEGHHMKSVSKYPQHAGNPHNIQFLNRSEHVNGAHKGNTQNPTNGYYNPKTQTMHSFGNRNPQAPPSQALSAPLTQRQQSIAIKSEQARQQAAKQAKAESKQAVSKTVPNSTQTQSNQQRTAASQVQSKNMNSQSPVTPASKSVTNKGIESARNQSAMVKSTASSNTAQPTHNKGIESARQKATAKPSGTSASKSTNQGIASYQNKSSGQSKIASKGSSGGASKGSSASSGGKSSGSSSSGQSSGGQGR